MRSCWDEAERRQAVGEAVVHRLDLGAHLAGDLVGVDAEDPGGGDRVEVVAGAERLDQPASSDRCAMIRISIWL